jgi:surface antigen
MPPFDNRSQNTLDPLALSGLKQLVAPTKSSPVQNTAPVLATRPLEAASATSKRPPVVIKPERKKNAPFSPLVQKKHLPLMKLLGAVLPLFILSVTFLSASSLSHDLGWNFTSLPFDGNFVQNPRISLNNLLAQTNAIANYYHQNDYDSYSTNNRVATDRASSLAWPAGQCTFWANYEYHRDSGYWVSWSGNADQWVAGAHRAGWIVSSLPHVSSIMVLMPHVQGASAHGHVAVVKSIINSTTVYTSNMNWYANGGGFNRVSFVNFRVGPGVFFIWHP